MLSFMYVYVMNWTICYVCLLNELDCAQLCNVFIDYYYLFVDRKPTDNLTLTYSQHPLNDQVPPNDA